MEVSVDLHVVILPAQKHITKLYHIKYYNM